MLNILSIDLDWFNIYSGVSNLRRGIQEFFKDLSSSIKLLSATIVVVRDHHYLYPWCLHLLKKHNDTCVSVVNIDEHHDFYNLNKYNWKLGKFSKPVDCGNFFAFMAYDRVLVRYNWVVSNISLAAVQDAGDFRKTIAKSTCANIQGLLKNSFVWEAGSAMIPIHKHRVFHGLLISESPGYTHNRKIALTTTLQCLEKFFPKRSVRFHKCRKDFPYSRRKKIGMKRLVG